MWRRHKEERQAHLTSLIHEIERCWCGSSSNWMASRRRLDAMDAVSVGTGYKSTGQVRALAALVTANWRGYGGGSAAHSSPVNPVRKSRNTSRRTMRAALADMTMALPSLLDSAASGVA